MVVVRRVYILLVSAISLQSVVWAIIVLLRNLLLSELNAPKSAIALQTAVIIVGLPIFLVHWLWAQRLADGGEEERVAALRRFYLTAVMAAFVVPFAANAFSLLNGVLRQLMGAPRPSSFYYPVNTLGAGVVYYGAAMLILTLFWLYHYHVFQQDNRGQESGPTAAQALALRLYIFIFAAVGLAMIVNAMMSLLRWLLFQLGDAPAVLTPTARTLAAELTRLLVGLGLWLLFWLWAQRLFAHGPEMERESALRKFYLYAAVFLGAVVTVASAAAILAGIISRILQAPTSGDIREALAALAVMGVVWAYHAVILHRDAGQSVELPQQAGIRRLYRYLVAGVGLLALLIGLGGVIGIFFFTLDGQPFVGDIRRTLAWFMAAIIAGLLVWLLPWRQIQAEATGEDGAAAMERQSLARKIYLYLFIFMATMTVLGAAVYMISQLVELLLASRATAHLLRDLGMALAYTFLAVGLWLYHGAILRSDNRAAVQEQQAGLSTLQVVILSGDQPALMARLRQGLRQKLPQLQLPSPLEGDLPEETAAALAQADVIIMPATFAWDNSRTALVTAVTGSPAYKLLLPAPQQNYFWLGLDKMDETAVINQTAQALRQIAAGESVRPARSLGLGTILLLIVGGFMLLSFLFSLTQLLIYGLF